MNHRKEYIMLLEGKVAIITGATAGGTIIVLAALPRQKELA